MRLPRLMPPAGHPHSAFVHAFSRVVDKRFIFDAAEARAFLSLLRELAAFCRIRVLSFAILSDHFHLLLEVPPKPPPDLLPDHDQILLDLAQLSGHQDVEGLRQRWELLRAAGDSKALAADLARFHARLYNLSFLMKLLKQRFTQNYNARHDRKGTLWESRFKSVLVEGTSHALVTMAAYIDLNPVRAGLVKDPKDFPWCGYGLAFAGDAVARDGIQRIVTALAQGQAPSSQEEGMATYRIHLHIDGDESRSGTAADGRPQRRGLSREQVLDVLAARGKVHPAEYLRCRVRYFCDGAILGSREFVEGVFQAHRRWFGPRRTTGSRRMRGWTGDPIYAVRDLKVRLFG